MVSPGLQDQCMLYLTRMGLNRAMSVAIHPVYFPRYRPGYDVYISQCGGCGRLPLTPALYPHLPNISHLANQGTFDVVVPCLRWSIRNDSTLCHFMSMHRPSLYIYPL